MSYFDGLCEFFLSGVRDFELCSLPCHVFKQPKIHVLCSVLYGGDESPEPLQW